MNSNLRELIYKAKMYKIIKIINEQFQCNYGENDDFGLPFDDRIAMGFKVIAILRQDNEYRVRNIIDYLSINHTELIESIRWQFNRIRIVVK